jgi:uncharacterized protein Yka (UPF0111/DUF47 family)
MDKKEILASLQNVADDLDETGLFSEANTITNVMQKLAYETYDYAEENMLDNTVEAETEEEDQDGIDQEIYKRLFDQYSDILNK